MVKAGLHLRVLQAACVRGASAAGALAAAAGVSMLAAPAVSFAAGTAEITARASAGELRYGSELTLTGRVAAEAHGLVGAPLTLQADPYPYRGFITIARAASATDGNFTFDVRPDRDTRLRVALEGSSVASAPVAVTVDPAAATSWMRQGAGRTLLSLRLGHAPQLHSRATSAWWFTAARGSRRFQLVAVSSTRELSPGLTYASAAIEPPSAHFAYRVCVNPAWGAAMGGPASRRHCPHDDFTGAPGAPAPPLYGGQARGTVLAAFPPPAALAAASRFLSTRAGRASFAVVDSHGRLRGARVHEHFATASVVKVMMLVAYLQMLGASHRALGAADEALLYPMIHVSDNGAASAVLSIVGNGALARVAREAGMSDYAPAAGWWAFTQTSSADQARLMFALPRLIPGRFYGYARELLAGIEASQSWGIPPVARPRWRVYFKTGWLPEEGIFTEVARLERHAVAFSLAVLTSDEPSMSYGMQTIAGVAAALLARSPA